MPAPDVDDRAAGWLQPLHNLLRFLPVNGPDCQTRVPRSFAGSSKRCTIGFSPAHRARWRRRFVRKSKQRQTGQHKSQTKLGFVFKALTLAQRHFGVAWPNGRLYASSGDAVKRYVLLRLCCGGFCVRFDTAWLRFGYLCGDGGGVGQLRLWDNAVQGWAAGGAALAEIA